MEMFFKKIKKMENRKSGKMIYITEFDANFRLQFFTDWGERLNGGPKAQMLAHT